MSRAVLIIGAALVLAAALAHADDKPTAGGPVKFRHDAHAHVKGLESDDCKACHAAAKDGSPAMPGADGHKPCMTSGCHLEKGSKQGGFLDKNPKLCLGCHDSNDNFRKNPATRVYKDNPRPEHFVEFSHRKHVSRKKPGTDEDTLCTSCHWIDKQTFKSVAHPGHPQCASCHKQDENPITMNDCGGCHQDGAPADHFKKSRANVHLKPGAFTHEHVGHRFFDKDTMQKPIQCAACHTKVAKYDTLADLHGAPIITGSAMQGVCSKCHDVVSGNLCNLCHTDDIKGTQGSFHFLEE
jgi:predicted CXXCH cytochrome family protein